MRPPESFAIERDARYLKTRQRDLRRQAWRRQAHALAARYEALVKWPAWKQHGQTTQRLSVCLITMNAQDRIRPLLEYLRPWADELVVGVDSKTTDNTYQACEGLVDELFWIENPYLTCNAGLEALVSHCHGDWLLRLDDDEFPEPGFWAIKNALMDQTRYTHYKLPRLHLTRLSQEDEESPQLYWSPDGYLYPDFQLRLMRNDPKLLSFPGAVGHSSIACQGPRGKIHSVNLVHLNLAINPRAQREQKLQKYIDRHQSLYQGLPQGLPHSLPQGLHTGQNWVHPINEHVLLFEDFDYCEQPYKLSRPQVGCKHLQAEAFYTIMAQTIQQQRQAYALLI